MLLPIVNCNDEEIGVRDRDSLSKDDTYRVSALWITNSMGQYLLAQRAMTKKKYPGRWGPAVAGTVEVGETYDSNIVKEIQEELGITIRLEELKKGPKIKRETHTGSYFSQWYSITLDKELCDFSFPLEEVMAIKWFSKEEFKTGLRERPEEFLPIFHDHLETILLSQNNNTAKILKSRHFMSKIYFKTLGVNLLVFMVILVVELLFRKIENNFLIPKFESNFLIILGTILILVGLIFRFGAAYAFYKTELKVLFTKPQEKLIQTGMYAISRNPLYVGILCIAFGLSLVLGSIASVTVTLILLIFWHFYQFLYEENKLEEAFGDEYRRYKNYVSRWLGKIKSK